jgi:hypothetical protein
MKCCSHYSGHDLAEDLPSELPAKDRIDHDLSELKAFYNSAGDSRSKLRKSLKYEVGVEPVLF